MPVPKNGRLSVLTNRNVLPRTSCDWIAELDSAISADIISIGSSIGGGSNSCSGCHTAMSPVTVPGSVSHASRTGPSSSSSMSLSSSPPPSCCRRFRPRLAPAPRRLLPPLALYAPILVDRGGRNSSSTRTMSLIVGSRKWRRPCLSSCMSVESNSTCSLRQNANGRTEVRPDRVLVTASSPFSLISRRRTTKPRLFGNGGPRGTAAAAAVAAPMPDDLRFHPALRGCAALSLGPSWSTCSSTRGLLAGGRPLGRPLGLGAASTTFCRFAACSCCTLSLSSGCCWSPFLELWAGLPRFIPLGVVLFCNGPGGNGLEGVVFTFGGLPRRFPVEDRTGGSGSSSSSSPPCSLSPRMSVNGGSSNASGSPPTICMESSLLPPPRGSLSSPPSSSSSSSSSSSCPPSDCGRRRFVPFAGARTGFRCALAAGTRPKSRRRLTGLLGLLLSCSALVSGDDGGRSSGFWRIAAGAREPEPRTAGDPKRAFAGERVVCWRAPKRPADLWPLSRAAGSGPDAVTG